MITRKGGSRHVYGNFQTVIPEGVYNYGLVIFLMMTGLYLVLSKGNMIKSIIGLNLFQVSVIMFYVSMGRIENGTAPILLEKDIPHEEAHSDDEHGSLQSSDSSYLAAVGSGSNQGHKTTSGQTVDSESHDAEATVYSNPLPHVLMLTAIVVGVATTALALSLVVESVNTTARLRKTNLIQSTLLLMKHLKEYHNGFDSTSTSTQVVVPLITAPIIVLTRNR